MSMSFPVPIITWFPSTIGRIRREVLLIETGDFFFPYQVSVPGVEAHHPVVMQFEVDVVVPHANAACSQTRPAARLPVEMPQHRAVMGFDGIDVIGRRRIDHVVYEQHPPAEARRATGIDIASAEPIDGDSPRAGNRRTAAGLDAGDLPLQAQVLHSVGVDLIQQTIALAAEISRIAGPLVLQRLQHIGWIQTTGLCGQHHWSCHQNYSAK
jgi:hypothetical protein